MLRREALRCQLLLVLVLLVLLLLVLLVLLVLALLVLLLVLLLLGRRRRRLGRPRAEVGIVDVGAKGRRVAVTIEKLAVVVKREGLREQGGGAAGEGGRRRRGGGEVMLHGRVRASHGGAQLGGHAQV